jgi:nucleotide-binding universal stress UspA family protein
MKLARILVPLDGSMLAETALAAACSLAARDGATISLVRAAEVTTSHLAILRIGLATLGFMCVPP